jgi:hypothetical protein
LPSPKQGETILSGKRGFLKEKKTKHRFPKRV